jgi:acetyl-CoA carboxylase carboxyl transferase subunit beta
VARDEETEDIQVEVEREETPREQPPARAKLHPNTCPVCKSHYREDELRAVLRVCTVCGHHFPVGAEERVDQLADPGSFRPLAEGLRSADPLAFTDLRPYTERLSEAEVATGLGDAMVAGTATVAGMPCVLCTMDFTFMGGSMGSVVGEIFTRASDVAAERGIPLVSVTSSGGARMQENILALMQMAKTVCAVDLLQESGVPYISVLAHPTTGGVIASFAALGDFVVSEPGALLSFAGPRVVQETTRETLPADFGRAESSFEHGLIDAVVTRHDLKPKLGQILRLCAGGTLVPMEPNGDAAVPPPGIVARVMRFLRSSQHGDPHTNGGPA